MEPVLSRHHGVTGYALDSGETCVPMASGVHDTVHPIPHLNISYNFIEVGLGYTDQYLTTTWLRVGMGVCVCVEFRE